MEKELLERLREYTSSKTYPFHMPGHKRQVDFPNPYDIDITEVEGFDNLHHAEGILKESMEWAAEIYGADKTYYLVNGTSGGILSAIGAVTEPGGAILVSRNCHKAVYHGIYLSGLKAIYGYPQIIGEYGLVGGLLPEDAEKLLITHPEIQAVLAVSPTYDGIVSDIRGLARVAHRFGVPLIVDEAHGAHLPFDEGPEPALSQGADIVIQSVHKTLPSLTQTAILHVRSGLVKIGKLERYLQIYQSSSPSYVLMSSIERALSFMCGEGRERLGILHRRLADLRRELREMKVLKLVGPEFPGRWGVQAFDETKLLVYIPDSVVWLKKGTKESRQFDGVVLSDALREIYGLEMEMSAVNYVVGLTSCMDTEDGFARLGRALRELDRQLTQPDNNERKWWTTPLDIIPQAVMTIAAAWNHETEAVSWESCVGRVSAEFIYLYPPGIPILAPGEIMTPPLRQLIERYQAAGLTVHGGGTCLECVMNR